MTILPATTTVLSEAAARITTLEKTRLDSELRFRIEVLPILLKQGLHCLKAHCAFAVQDPKKRGSMKGKKSSSTVDVLSPESFEGWLATTAPWLKKGNAYRYMSAVRGLGLTDSAEESDVDLALEARGIENLSLKLLCNSTLDTVAPPTPEPLRHEQAEFDFLRKNLSDFREQSENICRLKSQLDAYPDFKRAATARVYGMLFELTGTHWAPSDEADSLATIDPDSITI